MSTHENKIAVKIDASVFEKHAGDSVKKAMSWAILTERLSRLLVTALLKEPPLSLKTMRLLLS